MAEMAKCQSNLPQLEIQGYYRAVAAKAIGNVYARNIARRQLGVYGFAQSDF